MPVPSLVTDLSTTVASNSPAGSDNVFPDLDNYLRTLSAFLASIRDNSGNGWVSPYLTAANPSYTGTLTGGTGVVNLGSGQFYKSAAGNVGIGTTTPDMALDVAGTSDSAINIRTNGVLQVRNNASSTRAHAFLSVGLSDGMVGGNLRIDETVTTGTHIGYANGTNSRGGSAVRLVEPSVDTDSGQVVFLRSDNTALNDDGWVVNESGRFDADGRLLIGNSFAVNTRFATTSWAPSFEVHGISLATASMGAYGWGVNPYFMFSRSSSSTVGNYAISTTSDLLGSISFAGADGAKFVTAATIRCQVAGTPALDSMPGELQFLTTGTGATPSQRMVITKDGNVGIGITNPSTPLEVSTSAVAVANFVSTSASTSGPRVAFFHDSASPAINDTLAEIRFSGNNSAAATVIYGSIAAVAKNVTSGAHSTQLQFNNYVAGASTNSLILDPNGYALVGYTTSNGAYRLQVNSQIFATSATIATSDGRYKQNVQPLAGALDVVKALRPVSFDWKQHPVHNFDTANTTVGFIAQEVQQVLAEKPYLNSIVKRNETELPDGTKEEFLGIAEGNLVAVLTAAIQEQQNLINDLRARVAALEA